MQTILRFCDYQILPEQPCTWQPKSRLPPHHFHLGSTHSRAKHPPWGQDQPPRKWGKEQLCSTKLQLQQGMSCHPLLQEATANREQSIILRTWNITVWSTLEATQSMPKDSSLLRHWNTQSSLKAQTDSEQQCNKECSQLFIEPMQDSANSFSSLLH